LTARLSWAERLAALSPPDRAAAIAAMTEEQLDELRFEWEFWRREEQTPPAGDWRVWLYLAGRGSGKTRTGAEFVRASVKAGCRRIALVAPTAADARDVMVEGESGILGVSPPATRPIYEPSKRRVTWRNGAIATTYSADEPERLRGPQHDAAWCDEVAAWRYPEAWDMLMFGLRLGKNPRVMVTTTPRPTRLIRELVGDPTIAVTSGSSYRNAANLAPAFVAQIIKKYEGTRLGRQELNAELLEDVPGALWNRALIEAARAPMGFVLPDLVRVVVAIDPAASSGEDADETGIIVAGKDKDSRGYVLADLSGHYMPIEWAKIAVAAYKNHGADRVVAEINNGGEMVEATLRVVDDNLAYTGVHATRGKVVRAEPVAALYEQGRIWHMGAFTVLEDQMCEFTPDLDRSKPKRDPTDPSSRGMGGARSSPDRADALVWAFTELLVEEIASWGIYEVTRRRAEAVLKERAAAFEAGRPKTEYAIGSMEWMAQHPDWKPQED
jgi:phage terminase large subunit-like protein